ncbi:hypothetical protein [Nocardia cyriacigeorgica]|nr:hypothetical protein [Nocardia cyriacigeorgica]
MPIKTISGTAGGILQEPDGGVIGAAVGTLIVVLERFRYQHQGEV